MSAGPGACDRRARRQYCRLAGGGGARAGAGHGEIGEGLAEDDDRYAAYEGYDGYEDEDYVPDLEEEQPEPVSDETLWTRSRDFDWGD